MSRSAKDATRFTATVPHAFVKSTPAPKQAPRFNGNGGPIGNNAAETAKEKVARLRAEHMARKAADFSVWDRVVIRGRMVADTAHKVTVIGLITFTVIAGGVAAYSLGDMVLYNRRKRRDWYAEQTRLREERLVEARAAAASGTLNGDQILLLNQERAKDEATEAAKNRPGFFRRTSRLIFGVDSLKKEDDVVNSGQQPSGSGPSAATKEEAAQLVNNVVKMSKESSVLKVVEEKRREGEKELEKRGIQSGPLDQTAEKAVEAASQKSKSWTGWLTGR